MKSKISNEVLIHQKQSLEQSLNGLLKYYDSLFYANQTIDTDLEFNIISLQVKIELLDKHMQRKAKVVVPSKTTTLTGIPAVKRHNTLLGIPSQK